MQQWLDAGPTRARGQTPALPGLKQFILCSLIAQISLGWASAGFAQEPTGLDAPPANAESVDAPSPAKGDGAQQEAPVPSEDPSASSPDAPSDEPPASSSPDVFVPAGPAPQPTPPALPAEDPYAKTQPPDGASLPRAEASSADAPLPKTPGAQPPPRWADADEMIEVAAEGSIETCEALTLPLTFIPGIGSAIGSVVEWACLFPAAVSVDYTQAFHGNRASLLWQAGLGLIMAKLWREALKIAAIGAVIGLVAAGFGVAGALAFVAPYYIPVAIAGLVTVGGVGFLAWKRIRSGGADALFSFTYWLLSGEFEDDSERQEVQDRAPVKYRMTGLNRAWALMATAAGAQPERQLWFYIPIFGAWGKAMARADAVKAAMRRTADDVLDEERIRDPATFAAVDNVIDGFAYAEGGLMAGAHAMLIGGGLLFTIGTGFAAVRFQGENDFANYATLAVITGVSGIVVASGGVVFLGVREIVKAFRPFAAPLVYGITPPEDAALDANAE